MRVLILALLISCFSYGQDITTVHFNYKWNQSNAFKGLDKLKSTKVQYAFVEEQSDVLKKSIKSVPTIVIYKENRHVAKFEAGLSLKISVPLDSLQAIIDRHKK